MDHISTLKAENLTLSHKCTSWRVQTFVKYHRICNSIPTGSAGLTRLSVHARKGIFSSLVGSYRKNYWSGRIIVRGKKKRWQDATRENEGFHCWENGKLRLPASCWSRNIMTSVSLKTLQNLCIWSCVGHCVDKNKHRNGAEERATHMFFIIRPVSARWDAPPVFYLLQHVCSVMQLWEDYPANTAMVFSLVCPSLVHNSTLSIITTLYL